MKSLKVWGIVGPVGVGKTTLTKSLCTHYNAKPIYEEWENNPYLEDFYRSENLFVNQLWFIKNDFDRFQRALISDNNIIIVDKLFIQNYTYIQITDFNGKEKKKCVEEYRKGLFLLENVDLIINLIEEGSVIKNRILSRDRNLDESVLSEKWLNDFQSIQSDYINELSKENKFKAISYKNSSFNISDLTTQIDASI